MLNSYTVLQSHSYFLVYFFDTKISIRLKHHGKNDEPTTFTQVH